MEPALPICRGHPASNVEKNPRQVSWLSGRRKPLGLPEWFHSVAEMGRLLFDYSCGGSSGIAALRGAPDSLLSRRWIQRREP